MPERQIVIGVHDYQPSRAGTHNGVENVYTDPADPQVDWTLLAHDKSYAPRARKKLYPKTSFDLQPTLGHHEFDRMIAAYPDRADEIRETRKIIQSSMAANGVATPYIHALGPDLSDLDQRINIAAGYKQFEKDAGNHAARFVWVPETALNTRFAYNLAQYYEGVLCAPEQIQLENGRSADDQPTRLKLVDEEGKEGKGIIALPFDGLMSRDIGLKDKSNADFFADASIAWKYNFIDPHNKPIIWTDGETFGLHWEQGDEFLRYLLYESLPRRGITPISINELKLDNVASGRLNERTAWSCPHGDLVRWHGGCGCTGGDSRWKEPFYRAHHLVNGMITGIIKDQLAMSDDELVETMSDNFGDLLANPGKKQIYKDATTSSLLSAKATSEAGVTSCGTFFPDPWAVGLGNMLKVQETLLHLKDAGLTEQAKKVRDVYIAEMAKMPDPVHPGKTGVDMIGVLLSKRLPKETVIFSQAA